MFFKIKQEETISLTVFLGIIWIFSAVGDTYIPYFLILKSAFLFLTIFLFYKELVKNKIFVFFFIYLILVVLVSNITYASQYLAVFVVPIILGKFLSLTYESRELFLKILTFSLYICLFALIYETLTNSYLVTVEQDMVGRGLFRCGLFANSKESGMFLGASSIIISNRKKSHIPISIALLGTLLTACRTGTLMSFCALLYSLYHSSVKEKVFYSIIFIAVFSYVFSFINDFVSIDRVFEMLSTKDDGNSDRLFYIGQHFNYWSDNLSLSSLVLGCFGETRRIVGNGMESAWTRLLIDGGVPMLIIYLRYTLQVLCRKGSYNKQMLVFIFAMTISGFGLGFSTGTLLWYFIFSQTNYKKKIQYETMRNI